jgi:hypothetical protein
LTSDTLNNVATIAGAILTVMIFSYLLGDNFLYRIAIHVFIGAAAAFTLIVAIESVLIPWFQVTFSDLKNIPQVIIGVIPIVVGLLLLLKLLPGFSRLGNLGLAAILGVGTALALWGAITATLLPLTLDSARSQGNILDTLVAVLGTVTVLIYFTYLGVRRPTGDVEQSLVVRVPGLVGQTFLMVTLGATYGLLIISALTILTKVIQTYMALRTG